MSLCAPQVLGALNLLLALLHGSPAQELVAGFLLEPGNLEVLLALLVRPWPLPQLPERICKVPVPPTTPDPGMPPWPCLRPRELGDIPRGDSALWCRPPCPGPAQAAAERAPG